ncbi:MAG: hypothetical protein ABS43_31695 [Bordetella sp. SCN 67-23]|nr:hypothetical protein [Burkholderiales bacterium]ODS65505.1 MAG: hypothetical protein ABS43_31695 [Bordetella sp. SCN 67-23]ODU82969.1 MAG: hypothetical protein ABT00_10655 [Bordetella sp. SCN 68-11]OJW86087.1 MAG: hypothetical protein BGO71_12310 [Burkholderiales bacterium 67-32]
MNLTRNALAAVALAAALHAPGHAADAAAIETETQMLKTLLTAIEGGNYQQFVSSGSADFAKLDRAQFDAVATQLGPRLHAGYQVQRLGDYRQQSYEFSLWKITFKDGGDDLVGTLNLQGGKVGGFVLR